MVTEGDATPPFDLHVPLMSLPLVFGTRAGAPYLRAEPLAVASWRTRWPTPAGRLRVGLAWSGNPAHGDDRNRSVPFETLTPLLTRSPSFVSLQTEVRSSDVGGLARAGSRPCRATCVTSPTPRPWSRPSIW